jgi:hypothetical protein
MEKQISLPNRKRPASIWGVLILCLLWLGVFAWVYYYEPVTARPFPNSDYWNDKVLDVLTLIPALAASVLGLTLTRRFKPSEPPYRIWLTFTIGWWMWVGGELAGIVYDHYYWFVDYPEFTYIDLFWLLGYLFFSLSLYFQFQLIYNWKRGRESLGYLAYLGLAAVLTAGLTLWALAAGLGEGYSMAAIYLAIIYPVFDLFVGAAALWLFFLFGRGFLGRPWWGLIAFAVADSINIYSWIGGFDHTLDNIYLAVDLFSSVAFVAGYMITALAFLSAIRHMRQEDGAPRIPVPPELARD